MLFLLSHWTSQQLGTERSWPKDHSNSDCRRMFLPLFVDDIFVCLTALSVGWINRPKDTVVAEKNKQQIQTYSDWIHQLWLLLVSVAVFHQWVPPISAIHHSFSYCGDRWWWNDDHQCCWLVDIGIHGPPLESTALHGHCHHSLWHRWAPCQWRQCSRRRWCQLLPPRPTFPTGANRWSQQLCARITSSNNKCNKVATKQQQPQQQQQQHQRRQQ